MFGLANFALNFCQSVKLNHLEVIELIFYGDFVVGMSCHPHKTTC
jgi:hypothetical protein